MVRRMLLTAVAFALLAAPPAVSAASDRADASAPERAGIAHAKAAGISVDPAVEKMMARAPVGTCANDPTLPGCSPVHAFVYAPEFFHAPIENQLRAATIGRKQPGRVTRIKASAAPFYACYLKVNYGSPYGAAGYAQMDTQNYCIADVTDVDIYLVLKKYYNYRWNNMIGQWRYPTVPQKWWHGSLRYKCTAYPRRQWMAQADAYAVYRGVRYGGTQSKQASFDCG